MEQQSFVKKVNAERAAKDLSFPLVHHFTDVEASQSAGQAAFLQVDVSQPCSPDSGHWKDKELLLSLKMQPHELAVHDAVIVTIDALRAPNIEALHKTFADAPKFGADYGTAVYEGKNQLSDNQLQFKAVMQREDAAKLLEKVAEQTGVELPSVSRQQGRGR